MDMHLLVIAGPDKGRTFELTPGPPLQIGRSQTTATRLVDPRVSRVHCEVRLPAFAGRDAGAGVAPAPV